MTVPYLKFHIKNKTGGCYDWQVELGGNMIGGTLEEVKRKVMAYVCRVGY
ncbi:hypothetical protein ACSI5N_25530 (plasmid) [Raoultella ornithinolytica]|nr:hypothetical protein [Raoultella ornithinolytica]MDV1094988.1 hypothetical protein [Raoultella ornithinolytica]MDV1122668.1 hypothetical protein [Raoultella ornithinolytica]MDV1893183.1 hypothetical protein [Raoultella ornithinolytica]